MLTILSRWKKLAPPVFKSSVLLEQTVGLTSVCPVRVRCYSQRLPQTSTLFVSSCQRWYHVHTSHLNTKRYFSENYGENSISTSSVDVLQEESHETDSNRRQRSPATFSLDVLVSLLRQENAVDICVIKVPEDIKYAEYFIVVSGVSVRHLRAMAFYAIKMYKFLKKKEEPNVKFEGKDAEDWMCIDFGDMVVHFMLPETREVYELEKLWTLRAYDEQLTNIPPETLPEDFIYDDTEVTK